MVTVVNPSLPAYFSNKSSIDFWPKTRVAVTVKTINTNSLFIAHVFKLLTGF
jgi:hypothetical protein